jgi:hypothetical protein
MKEQLPLAIVKDLAHECADRTCAEIYRKMALVDHPLDQLMISIESVMRGLAIGTACLSIYCGEKFDPVDLGIALLTAISDGRSDGDLAEVAMQHLKKSQSAKT